jgi:phospholipid N-methyltransferase
MVDNLFFNLKKRSPTLYSIGRHLYWKLRKVRDSLLGTVSHEKYWTNRHLYGGSDWDTVPSSNGFINDYWNSKEHTHRPLLLQAISKFSPSSSILEIGCNCGPNLYLLAREYPNARIEGIDINTVAVETGNKLFKQEGIKNVKMQFGKADELSQFKNNEFDIVFTDAVLIYIGPDKIKKVMNEIIRITQKALILIEWHYELPQNDYSGLGVYYYGCWIRNYVNLLKQFPSVRNVHVTKIPVKSWESKNWRDMGYIIEASK